MSRRLVGAALLVVAGVVALIGTFLPLYWQGGGDVALGAPRFTTTSWRVRFDDVSGLDIDLSQSPQFGVPIAVAAVLLAVAAALVFLPEAQRLAARYLAIAATGVLAGAVAATGSVVLSAVDTEDSEDGAIVFASGAGEGIALLVASVVVAVVGVVLVHARRDGPVPDEPGADGPVVYRLVDDVEGDDTDTPPFGIPVAGVEVAQIPESRYERPSDASDPGGKTP